LGEESCENGLLVLLGGVFEEELEDFGEVGVAHGVDDGNGGEYLLEDGLEGGTGPYLIIKSKINKCNSLPLQIPLIKMPQCMQDNFKQMMFMLSSNKNVPIIE
jgi:hypothetical protein